MASAPGAGAAPSTTTGTIRINIVDGARQPIPDNLQLLIRILDGRKREVLSQWATGSAIPVQGLPFHNSPDDWYTVIVHASGYQDGAIYPVRLQQGRLVDAWLMLEPNHAGFQFAKIETIQADARLYQLLANGAPAGADGVATRYHDTLEAQPMMMGALLTLGTAIRDIPLDDLSSPLDYYWEVMWDDLMPDRFFAWVDARLADRIGMLEKLHSFAAEDDPAHWHPGIPGKMKAATRSWKQTRFDVANVQLTFHEDDKKRTVKPNGSTVDCVIVEPDIDYYKDLLAHGLFEVLPNLATGGKTDPRTVYSLRWTSTMLEGLTEFNPPLTLA
jgi:hypothetical protein